MTLACVMQLEPREPVLPLTLKERQALFPVKQSGSLLPTHGPVFLATPAVWRQLQQRSHRSLVQLHAASSSSSFQLKEVSASTEPLPAASIHHWVFVPSYNRYADSDPRQMRIDWADAVSQDTQYVRVVVVRSEAEQVMVCCLRPALLSPIISLQVGWTSSSASFRRQSYVMYPHSHVLNGCLSSCFTEHIGSFAQQHPSCRTDASMPTVCLHLLVAACIAAQQSTAASVLQGYSKLVHEHQLQVEKHLHEASQITLLMVMPHTINLGALPSSFADLREYQRQQQTEAMGIGYSRLATQLIARLMGLSSIWMLDDNISDCWRLPFEEFVRSEGKQHAQLESVKFSTVMATIECQVYSLAHAMLHSSASAVGTCSTIGAKSSTQPCVWHLTMICTRSVAMHEFLCLVGLLSPFSQS